jgi:hypothetical protein
MFRILMCTLSLLLTGCISHRLTELEHRVEILDTRLDFEVWNNEAEHCYFQPSLTRTEVEQCEIDSYKKWRKIRDYKEGK